MPSQLTHPMLDISHLTVTYRNGLTAVRNTQLTVHRGEAVGIYGASGGGKTTLARAIPGLLPPSCSIAGSIRFDNEEILQMNAKSLQAIRGARIASLFQEPSLSLSPHLRIGTQISEVIAAHRGLREKERNEATIELLQPLFGSEAARITRAYPNELSGGQRQRAAMARALCCQPELVVADEPTAALDSIGQREVFALLTSYRERTGMAVVLISHNRAALGKNTGRMLELRDGRLEPV